uniref:Uncharacterized protein n=1 Tax=Parascaris univalens TaxID=6257 RepID=A0A915BKK9_PARUN
MNSECEAASSHRVSDGDLPSSEQFNTTPQLWIAEKDKVHIDGIHTPFGESRNDAYDSSHSGIEHLKARYLEQLRCDERKHRTHRSTPLPMRFAPIIVRGGTSLPNIIEAANEGSDESGSPSSPRLPTNHAAVLPKATSLATLRPMEGRTSITVSSISPVEDRRVPTENVRNPRSPIQSRSQTTFFFGDADSAAQSTLKRSPKVTQEQIYEHNTFPSAVGGFNSASSNRRSSIAQSAQTPPTLSGGRVNETPRESYREEIDRQPSRAGTSSLEAIDQASLPRSILKQSTSSISQSECSRSNRRTDLRNWNEESSQRSPHMPDVSSASQGPYTSNYETASIRESNDTPFEMQSEEERFRIMQENLQRQRQRSLIPQHRYPQTSFNGPFFKLEQVAPSQQMRSQSAAPLLSVEGPSDDERRCERLGISPQRATSSQDFHSNLLNEQRNFDKQRYNDLKMISASEAELTQHQRSESDHFIGDYNSDAPNVVYWPPRKERPRPASVMAKSITDPERIDEYRRQKQMELEAIRRKEEEAMRYRYKQMQQQRSYEQGASYMTMGSGTPVQMVRSLSPSSEELQQEGANRTRSFRTPSIDTQDLESLETPQQVRVFETRPISILSESTDSRDFLSSPSVGTWKRIYVVDAVQPAAKNEILTSDELLEKERFDVDILKRREAFIEKPTPKPHIFRTGKRWEPPPEQPYVWPTVRRPLSVQPGAEPVVDFAPGVPRSWDEVEFRWEPQVYDPGYKHERKNFTPTNSPPLSPRRGMGTGSLDEVAKRQTRYLITPSPDGSHRPKPAFGGPRATPSGGFYPHAPNAIKVVRKKHTHTARTPSPSIADRGVEDYEVIHERNYHRLGETSASPSRSSERMSRISIEQPPPSSSPRNNASYQDSHMADWEKIYDLPAHSSTLTAKDVPLNVDVKKRLAQFENTTPQFGGPYRQKTARDEDAQSKAGIDSARRSNQKGYHNKENRRTPLQRVPRQDFNPQPKDQRIPSGVSDMSLRRIEVTSVPLISTTSSHAYTSAVPHSGSMAVSSDRQHSKTPTSIQHEQQPQTAAQRRLIRIAQATAPSPAPASYERAHPYIPPPLPPGYKRPPSPASSSQVPTSTSSWNRQGTERNMRVSRSANAAPQHFATAADGSVEFSTMGSTHSIPISLSTPYAPVLPNNKRFFQM